MAKGSGSLISGVRREKEKEALIQTTKKITKATEQNSLLREALKQSNLLLKYLTEEQRNLMVKINSSSPSKHDPLADEGLQGSSLTTDDDGGSTSSKRVEDSDNHVRGEGVVSEEELRFTKMATSVVQGYNANKGREKYKFHKIVTVDSRYELPIWHYFLTFEVENLEAPVVDHAAAMRICRAEIDDYGDGEAYVESCSVMKNPLFVEIVDH